MCVLVLYPSANFYISQNQLTRCYLWCHVKLIVKFDGNFEKILQWYKRMLVWTCTCKCVCMWWEGLKRETHVSLQSTFWKKKDNFPIKSLIYFNISIYTQCFNQITIINKLTSYFSKINFKKCLNRLSNKRFT